MVIERVQKMSIEEFLDFAESSEQLYEYIDGELHPMTTPTFRHNIIGSNIAFSIRTLLAGNDCQVLGIGQGVRAGETRLLIPDVCVVCEEPLLEADTRILLNPILVVEVTSPSSIDRDRVMKRDYYGDVASIQAYLVVDQHRALVELYTRDGNRWWIDSYSKIDDEVPLAALNCSLSLRDIYRNVDFDAGESSRADEGTTVSKSNNSLD